MQSGEDKLIARYFKPLATASGRLVSDRRRRILRAARGHEVVLKTDAIVGGVHFLPDDPPDSIARKALRVNLSDLAAKGAKPAGFLLTLALPEAIAESWLESFAAGLESRLRAIWLSAVRRRHRANAGTGVDLDLRLRHAAAGQHGAPRRRQAGRPDFRHRHHRRCCARIEIAARTGAQGGVEPERRGREIPDRPLSLAAGRAWRWRRPLRSFASAAMDISDGLVGDLGKLCGVSKVSARIEAKALPLSSGARQALRCEPALIEPIATGGDDYEILCAMAPERVAAFRQAAEAAGVPVTEIGEVTAGEGPPLSSLRTAPCILSRAPPSATSDKITDQERTSHA